MKTLFVADFDSEIEAIAHSKTMILPAIIQKQNEKWAVFQVSE